MKTFICLSLGRCFRCFLVAGFFVTNAKVISSSVSGNFTVYDAVNTFLHDFIKNETNIVTTQYADPSKLLITKLYN